MTSEKYEMKRTLESHKRRVKVLEEQSKVFKKALEYQVSVNKQFEKLSKGMELVVMEQAGIKKVLFDLKDRYEKTLEAYRRHLKDLH